MTLYTPARRRCLRRPAVVMRGPAASGRDMQVGEEQMNRLAGKVAVITGAGAGIGRASANTFVAEGAKVVVAEIDEALGEASAREAGASARFVRTDVTDEESVKQMVRQARDVFGHIDVLLNCAGGSLREDRLATEVDLSVWDRTMSLDLKGPFL